jgi:hypothetical protein
MKGVVFTEFLEMVEDGFGMEVADSVITRGCPFHTAGFTAVGTYNHTDLLGMVSELSQVTATPAPALVQDFGKRMFAKFLASYPEVFERVSNTFELLFRVEDVIHVEVRKLHPDAELPTFSFPPAEPGCLDLLYESARPFADLAHGLIEACIEHFGEDIEIHRTDLPGDPKTHALFSLKPKT